MPGAILNAEDMAANKTHKTLECRRRKIVSGLNKKTASW